MQPHAILAGVNATVGLNSGLGSVSQYRVPSLQTWQPSPLLSLRVEATTEPGCPSAVRIIVQSA
jgi:hypothetical protein